MAAYQVIDGQGQLEGILETSQESSGGGQPAPQMRVIPLSPNAQGSSVPLNETRGRAVELRPAPSAAPAQPMDTDATTPAMSPIAPVVLHDRYASTDVPSEQPLT